MFDKQTLSLLIVFSTVVIAGIGWSSNQISAIDSRVSEHDKIVYGIPQIEKKIDGMVLKIDSMDDKLSQITASTNNKP